MFKKYVKPYTGRVVVNAIVKMIGTIFEVMLPAILAYIIDSLLPVNDRDGIILWGCLMVLFSACAWTGNFIANRMASYTSANIVRTLRHDLMDRALKLSPQQIDKLTVSSLETRLTTDTYNIHRFLEVSMRMGIRSIMLFIGGLIFCLILDWHLTLILLLVVPPIVILVQKVFGKLFSMLRELQAKLDDMVQVIRENIRGIRVSKALDKTEYEEGRFMEHNKDVADSEIELVDHMSIFGPSVNIILQIGQCLVIIVGAYLASQNIVAAGTITAFLSYFIQIANSVLAMNRMVAIYSRSKTSADRIEEILDMPIDANQIIYEPVVDNLPAAKPDVPEVEFRNVTFTYRSYETDKNYLPEKQKDKVKNGKENETENKHTGQEKQASMENASLKNISFKVYPGNTLGIIGKTGSGKSTIIKLLLRMYDPDSGDIFIRGVNIKNIAKETLHKMFGLVLQNDFVFSSTAKNNITFGREFTESELEFALLNAQAQDFIAEKGGLDYKLASRGVNLSGGQKQRILLSRALAGNPEILILDDSSSALDFATDAKLRQALYENYANTTSFIIAQRVSSIMHAEEIIVMKDGEVEDQGTHEELMQTSEEYAEIAELQLGASEVDFDSLYTLKEADNG